MVAVLLHLALHGVGLNRWFSANHTVLGLLPATGDSPQHAPRGVVHCTSQSDSQLHIDSTKTALQRTRTQNPRNGGTLHGARAWKQCMLCSPRKRHTAYAKAAYLITQNIPQHYFTSASPTHAGTTFRCEHEVSPRNEQVGSKYLYERANVHLHLDQDVTPPCRKTRHRCTKS